MKHRATRLIACYAVPLALALGCAKGGAPSADVPATPDGGSADAGPGACAPSCGPGQRCDETVSPPACAEICNPPAGCRPAWEACNADGGLCEPLRCGAQACQLGQGCFAPGTFEPIAGEASVCTCLPEVAEGASGAAIQQDSCGAYGMICGYDSATKAAAICRKPGAFERCLQRVGCSEGFGCASIPGGGLCLQSCSEGKDCRDPSTYCEIADGHCWPNVCAQPSVSAADRERYFKPCDSAGEADGTCLPTSGTHGELGLCFQAGTAPSRGPCDPGADRETVPGLCPVGEKCQSIQPGPSGGARALGVCATVCDAGSAATSTCPTGELCLDVSGAKGSTGTLGRLGLCVLSCDALRADSCPAMDALGNAMACFFDASLESGYCRAILQGAAALGSPGQSPDVAVENRVH
jgi:hypothetical protein